MLESEADALEMRWAPVFLQGVSLEHPERDRPLAVDFDGDWDATNNWRNLDSAHRSSSATVYGSAVLSETHAYLTYTLFYPRDWASPLCFSPLCHDNDLETVMVVVERPSPSHPSGKLVLVESKTHNGYPWAAANDLALDAAGHLLLYVESEGHGIHPALEERRLDDDARVRLVPREDSNCKASGDEHYNLLSLHDTLWAHRRAAADHGKLWIEGDKGFLGYRGVRLGRRGEVLGALMAQSVYTGGVRPPWGIEAAPGTRGDWLFDPAFVTAARHPSLMGSTTSTSYVLNPFLDDLSAECSGDACRAAPDPPAPSDSGWKGLGAGIVAVGLISSRLPRRAFKSLSQMARRLVRR